ncbi:hypothetical protein BHE74_00008963 [Ensete ventricosum]|nr:hypothetical protein GW17_00014974 [Ensete ventricosum]RWW82568.1 hypothetical protein BHE74_00008963 [Ensete ventricosum]
MRDRSNLVNPCGLQGLLDAQFRQLQMLQDASNPGFVAEVITLFCEDSERMLTELTKLLDQTVVDYQKVDAYVHQLKGSSSRCLLFFVFCAPFSSMFLQLLAFHMILFFPGNFPFFGR